MIRVERATIEQLPLLLSWRERVLREVFLLGEREDISAIISNNAEYYKREIPSGGHIACFAIDDDVIVGCGGLCLYDEMPSPDNPGGKCGYLMNVYVLQTRRKQGIGERIVRRLISEARAAGADKLYLESAPTATDFYRRIGFSDMTGYMKLQD